MIKAKQINQDCSNQSPLNIEHIEQVFKTLTDAVESIDDMAQEFAQLIRYTQSPLSSEEDVLARAQVMDELMDMAKGDDDITMVFANAIADRIEEYETEKLQIPKAEPKEVLAFMMNERGVKQKDLHDIAPQSVISEILNGKRTMTVDHINGFAKFFNIPVTMFFD